jgi:hypothetical protein
MRTVLAALFLVCACREAPKDTGNGETAPPSTTPNSTLRLKMHMAMGSPPATATAMTSAMPRILVVAAMAFWPIATAMER